MTSFDKLFAMFIVCIFLGCIGSIAAGVWGPVCAGISCVLIAFSPNKKEEE